jgi:hypothetical protein
MMLMISGTRVDFDYRRAEVVTFQPRGGRPDSQTTAGEVLLDGG